MKSKLYLVLLILVFCGSFAACSSPDVEITVNYAELLVNKKLNQEVEVKTGDLISVVLGHNPATGYEWEEPVIADTAIIQQKGKPVYIPPKERVPGAGGNQAWEYTALQAGTSNITMKYSQPWDGGEKGTWVYTLTVIVE